MAPTKDGSKPKRPMSAYMFFATEERSKVKKVQPTWSILEIAKELGLRWNATKPEGKARFEAQARKDKERYEREGGGRKERKGPKRPQSAYMFFVQEERVKLVKQHPTWTVPQVGSELGKRWRALTANQKKKHEVQAQADKGRYQREMGQQPSGGSTTGSASPTGNASSVKKVKKSSVKSSSKPAPAASPKKSPSKSSGKSSPTVESKSPKKSRSASPAKAEKSKKTKK